MDDLLDDVAKMMVLQAEARHIGLFIHLTPGVPFQVEGDSTRLKQVMLNLVNNAVKFTHEGEIVIKVELVEQREQEAVLHFSVRDTGIGMTPDQQEKLFRAFTQADGTTTRKYGGTGLGLIISQRIVNLMGGVISVESEFGVGSTFRFTIPLTCQPGQVDEELVLPAELQGANLLVVEEDATSRAILHDALAGRFGEIQFVSSCEEGIMELRHVGQDKFGMVLVNVHNLTGCYETMRMLRTKSDLPVVLLSTSEEHLRLSEKLKDLAHLRVLVKPVHPAALIRGMAACLRGEDSAAASIHPERQNLKNLLHDTEILVVDDNEINRKLLNELLHNLGATVEQASNGQQAIRAVAENKGRYDLVLMDLQMPGMDGYEATRVIREELNEGDLPIIAVSAHAMNSEKQRCLDAGMNDHLAKPIEPGKLAALLKQWIRADHIGTADMEDLKALDQTATLDVNQLGIDPDVIDIAHLIKRLTGNRGLAVKLTGEFDREFGDFCAKLRVTLDVRDYEKARFDLHNLKGVAGTLSMGRVQAAAAAVEKSVKEQNLGAIEQEFHVLDAAMRELFDVLHQADWAGRILVSEQVG